MNRKVTTETEMLRKARLRKGLSQQQVATLAGVHIRQYQRIEYGERPMADRLVPYLHAFNMQAEERAQRLVEQMKRAEGVTETLKARDPMEWVRRMNGIAARAEESVLQEMVYR